MDSVVTRWFCYRKVRVEVFNELETRQITNVFGIIHGRTEPGPRLLIIDYFLVSNIVTYFCCSLNHIIYWHVDIYCVLSVELLLVLVFCE